MACSRWIVCLLAVGLVGLVAGVVLVFTHGLIQQGTMHKILELRPGSKLYNIWLNPPVTVNLQLWFFNVTNPTAILAGGKPNIAQLGPYTYKCLSVKENITWKDGQAMLQFNKTLYYVFQPDLSVGAESDTILTVNLPIVGTATSTKNLPKFVQDAMRKLFIHFDEHLFKYFTVKDYLWGYSDPFFVELKNLLKDFGFKHIASQIPDYYGVFVGRGNASSQGKWQVGTGQHHQNDLNLVKVWNNNRQLQFWSSASANMLNGSDGSFWPPLTPHDHPLYTFYPQICRSVQFDYSGSHRSSGLTLHRYVWSKRVLESAAVNPENQGFCTPHCLPAGLMNLSSCAGGPFSLSLPHLTDADPHVQESVAGLHPSQEFYSMVDLDPMSGAGISSQTKLQFNADLQSSHIFGELQGISPVHLPVLWMNASATVTSSEVIGYCQKLRVIDGLIRYGPYAVLGVGLLLVVLGAALWIRAHTKNQKPENSTEPLLEDDSINCDTEQCD